MEMRVCDLIAQYLSSHNVKQVFMVSGGGSLFLTDGLYGCPSIEAVCCHHEQAAAMAAVGYARYKGFGCAYVTTGCGGTNAVTGVLNAWQDNIPCIFISGQCKRKETVRYQNLPIRQLGVQEADIVSIVQSITKYAHMLEDPQNILYELEKGFFLAKDGRPGPVWLDIPMDVQSSHIDIEHMRHFIPPDTPCWDEDLIELKEDLTKAKRPIIIAGGGIRLSETREEFQRFVERFNIPFVCSRMGTDVLPTLHPLNIGRIGNKGMRSANFALQNADLVLVLGSRLSVSSTGQEYEYFAREAKVYVIDIDEEEHKKNTVHIERFYLLDLRRFFKCMEDMPQINIDQWTEKCMYWHKKYVVCLPEYYESELVNVYVFVEELSKQLRVDSVIVSDTGSTIYVPPQTLKTFTLQQRYITSGAQAEMGFALPAAVGISMADNKREVFVLTGDGGLQMNIQELQTIKHYHLPIKIFVWNNNGYLSIRASQDKLCHGRKIGTDPSNGVSFPNLEKIAWAYDLRYIRISNTASIADGIRETLLCTEPVVCEVMCIPNQRILPAVEARVREDGTLASSPLEDMSPFLSRDEFLSEMIIRPVSE